MDMRLILTALLVLITAMPAHAADRIAACHAGTRVTCVVDGDTLWWRGEKIRLAGIDTPELEHPACPGPAAGAVAARDRLIVLINAASRIRISRAGQDHYGRTLAALFGDGEDLGARLVTEGLARVYVPGEAPWC